MLCANPHCSKELFYLREGRAELIELEPGSRDREWTDEGGFPVKSAPSRFFWLCGDCAEKLIIQRWTPSGLLRLGEGLAIADTRGSCFGNGIGILEKTSSD
jgi:hypothetical protein